LNQTKDLFYELDLVSWLQRLQFCEVNNWMQWHIPPANVKSAMACNLVCVDC
jgi:hypothetical protein